MYHPNLLRQLKKYTANGPVPEGWEKLLQAVSDSYDQYERDFKLNEHAFLLHENEYRQITEKLESLNQQQESIISKRTQHLRDIASIPLENPNPVLRFHTDGTFLFGNEPGIKLRQLILSAHQIDFPAFAISGESDLGDKGELELKINGSIYLFSYSRNKELEHFNFYGHEVTEIRQIQDRAFDNFYRLNNFLESTEAIYYIIYSLDKQKNFFTSRWPLYFGFNPDKENDPEQKKQSCLVPGSVKGYEDAMAELDFNGSASFKYEIINLKTRKQYWLQEDIRKKYDPYLKQVVTTGRIMDVTPTEFYKNYIVESENRFRQITESVPAMIIVSDHESKMVYVNKRAQDFIGEGIVEKNNFRELEKRVHPDYKKAAIDDWLVKMQQHEPYEVQFLVKNAEGEYRFLYQIAAPRFMPNGEFMGYIRTFFDMTNEHLYKQELELDKKQFELIELNSSDVTLIMDRAYVISYVSPGIQRLAGIPASEVSGRSLLKYLCTDCKKVFRDSMTGSPLQKNEVRSLTLKLRKKDGSLLWIELVISLFENETFNTDPQYILHIRDIHQQKLANDALQESETKYRGLFENMELGVLEVDNRERVVFLNKAFSKITGYKLEDLKGKIASRVLTPDKVHQELVREQNKMRRKGLDNAYEVDIRRKDGTAGTLIISGAPSYDMDGEIKGSIGIHWDVTEIRDLQKRYLEQKINREKEVLEARLQAEEDQRAEIGRDLHDGVGQLLAYNKLYLGMMKSRPKIMAEDIKELEATVVRTIEEVRRLARTLAPPAIRDLGLREAVIEMIDSYSILTTPRFRLKMFPPKDEDRLNMDKKIMLYRVLQELLNNTFKYAEAQWVDIHARFTADEIILYYSDDGKGFDINRIKKGVGLDSIRSRVEFYKGKVKITSALKKGTQTEIHLPTDNQIR